MLCWHMKPNCISWQHHQKTPFQEKFYTGNDEEDAEIRQAVEDLLEVAKYVSDFLVFFYSNNWHFISFNPLLESSAR